MITSYRDYFRFLLAGSELYSKELLHGIICEVTWVSGHRVWDPLARDYVNGVDKCLNAFATPRYNSPPFVFNHKRFAKIFILETWHRNQSLRVLAAIEALMPMFTPHTSRAAQILADNISVSKPALLTRTLLAHDYIGSEYVNVVSLWWLHMTYVYVGEFSTLLHNWLSVMSATIDITCDVDLVVSLRHRNCVVPCKRTLKLKVVTKTNKFTRTSRMTTIDKNAYRRVVDSGVNYCEYDVDRVCWCAALWWHVRSRNPCEPPLVWKRYFGWVDFACLYLPLGE